MTPPIKITLVVDNEAPPELVAEHGFAAWIDTGNECFLFDTGQGAALIPNAAALGIDLSRARALVLSHGHYDHTGAVRAFLDINPDAPVIYGHDATIGRFSCRPDEQPPRQIGMAEEVRQALCQLPAERRIVLDVPRYLRPGIGITGPVPRNSTFEDTGGPFYLDPDKAQADPITDDLSLWFETSDGLVILTGCCHSGLVNTVRQAQRISGVTRIRGIIGGLHLLNAGPERLDATIAFLHECAPDFLLPCHCTGTQVIERLRSEFGDAVVRHGGAGEAIVIAETSIS
jgi:7,8-dihydropterin-6-yl-methyl-4-(beta-D-ribofuranosyl)aminobenzene 5'-phosphate synthase